MGGRDQSEPMVAINRNRWSQSAGAPILDVAQQALGTPVATVRLPAVAASEAAPVQTEAA
jgi:hypothetical protein